MPKKVSWKRVSGPRAHLLNEARKRELVYVPTGESVSSSSQLELLLRDLGWERYYKERLPELIQFHRPGPLGSMHLMISVPIDFAKLTPSHMCDVAAKSWFHFEVFEL